MTGAAHAICSTCPVHERAVCAALEPQDRDKLARHGKHRSFERGEIVIAAGDRNMACATLVSGALKVSTLDADGSEHIVALIHPAGFVGELFAPSTRYEVKALTTSVLCTFSRADYEKLVDEKPALAGALLRRSIGDANEARDFLSLVGRKSAEAKVAGLVLALAKAAAHAPCTPAQSFDLPISRGEMADILGLTIETVSRQIRRLEEKEILRRTGARGVSITDPAKLATLAS